MTRTVPDKPSIVIFDPDQISVDHHHAVRCGLSAAKERYYPFFAPFPLDELVDKYCSRELFVHRAYIREMLSIGQVHSTLYRLFFMDLDLSEPMGGKAEAFHTTYALGYATSCREKAGSIQALNELHEHGYLLVAITNYEVEAEHARFKEIGLHVDRIITPDDSRVFKPSSRTIQAVIDTLRPSLDKTFVLCGSIPIYSDSKPSLDKGLRTILYWPMSKETAPLFSEKHVPIIHNLNQVLPLLGSSGEISALANLMDGINLSGSTIADTRASFENELLNLLNRARSGFVFLVLVLAIFTISTGQDVALLMRAMMDVVGFLDPEDNGTYTSTSSGYIMKSTSTTSTSTFTLLDHDTGPSSYAGLTKTGAVHNHHHRHHQVASVRTAPGDMPCRPLKWKEWKSLDDPPLLVAFFTTRRKPHNPKKHDLEPHVFGELSSDKASPTENYIMEEAHTYAGEERRR
ncbi:hypothetical protein FZEAL_1633 [Fusarium zealandicum]|uniref:Uncharacterized protein n=1 Tax=Fusarium zealandicum TaxID=1053134 RepID=A0A8H4USD6_9HYPO|nr:hypothetical protein FZEAL_1633 [Fusarium zealandicum]